MRNIREVGSLPSEFLMGKVTGDRVSNEEQGRCCTGERSNRQEGQMFFALIFSLKILESPSNLCASMAGGLETL
eukprot:scaffold136913_cov17-Tisochrysis_lutea.AAC.4